MSRDFPLPPSFADSARAWLADPRPGAAPRSSATVLLLRDADGGAAGDWTGPGSAVRVFMLHRAATMRFAPGAYVFPGGGLETVDLVEGDTAEDPSEASLRRTAAREVLEETGVELGPDLLTPVGHWVTPEFEPRRYSTWFFAAACPEGVEPALTTTEAITGEWVDPAEVIARGTQDPGILLPPTLVHLEQVARARSVEALLLLAPTVETVMPVPVDVDGAIMGRVEGLA